MIENKSNKSNKVNESNKVKEILYSIKIKN